MTKKIDKILKNAYVLTMNSDLSQFPHGAVAIQDDSIVAVGTEAEILQQFAGDEIVDCGGKVLMPGIVNAHTHVPMTLLRGLADDLRLDVWLMGYMMPVEREFVSPEFCRLGTSIACAEFIKGGVTSFADMYYFEDDVAESTAQAGLRAVLGQSVMKYPAPDAKSYEDALDLADSFIRKWKNHPLIVPAIAPHAPYTVTPEIYKAATDMAVKYDVPLHIHLAETALEVENNRAEHNMPVIPYVKKQGIFESKVIAAHCVHVDEGEIQTLNHYNAGVAHNPSSNLKLASGFAPIQMMLDAGLNVGIGTDGPASNNDLDMFEEIRLASFISKAVTNDPTSLPAWQAVLMATRMGAQAIHLGEITGSIEVGKRADLIMVDIATLHNSPKYTRDPNSVYVQLVYAAKSTDVVDVMVNGVWLMRDKSLLTLSEKELLEKADAYAKLIDEFLITREKSVLSKLIALGGSSEEESFEVQVKIQLPNLDQARHAIESAGLEILYQRHYKQHDTYFTFADPGEGRLRYREDDIIDTKGNNTGIRSRLTLLGQRSGEFSENALLSRSRYLAPATQPLRFYREYFKPVEEKLIQKDRLRWSVMYKECQFYINLDHLLTQPDQYFLEVKSTTWSRQDANTKIKLAGELIDSFGLKGAKVENKDYSEM